MLTKFILIFIFQFSFYFVTLCDRRYKLCVGQKTAKFDQKMSCQSLNDNEHSLVDCVIAKDRLECLRLLNSSMADFTVLHPEEMIIAKNMNVSIRATHELQKFRNVPVDYDVIGLVSYRIQIDSLEDLKNAKMCSVGFDAENGHDFGWNEIFSKFIEDHVVQQHCNANLSLIENRIAALEKHFGPSCKAGKWVPDLQQDRMLKQKYPGLCSLCDNPNSCSNKDKYWGRRGVAYCMTDCFGDVAWMRHDDWKAHLTTTPNQLCDEFFFLCPDGRVQLSTELNPCKWVSQPLPTIAVREEIASSIHYIVTDIANSLPSSDSNTSWKWVSRNLLSPYSRYIVEMANLFTPNYYLARATNYLSAHEDASGCETDHQEIRFCVQSNIELLKCQNMAQAARSYGILPELQCTFYNDCANALLRHKADVMSVSTDNYANTLRLNKDLKPILYQFDINLRHSTAVVKKSSNIRSFKQLRGKTACFGKYDDFGWNSVILQLMKENLLPPLCPYEKALKSFFGDICAIYSTDKKKVRQCDENVNSEYMKHESYIQSEVLECLTVGGGDVAFLDLVNLHARLEHEWHFKSSDYAYVTLCPGLAESPFDSQFNSSCYMYWATNGQLVIPSNTSHIRRMEISNTMKSIQNNFGENIKTTGTPSETFILFQDFNGVENILFQDNTKSLDQINMLQASQSSARSYETNVELYAHCDVNRKIPSGSAPSLNIWWIHTLIISISILHLFKYVIS